MTVREIQGFLLDQFKVEANGNFIGIVTDSVLEVVVDARRAKIRDEGTVRDRAVYLPLGIGGDGTKDVLGIS